MEFRNLQKQYSMLSEKIDSAINDVCRKAAFISGPAVKNLEKELAEYVGVKHCITCANGTDAITLALKAWGIGSNDVVFVPDFTFFSSGECPAAEGATCVFVDVDDRTFNISPKKLEEAIQLVLKEDELVPKVVVAVDLFGQPADYDEIKNICKKYNLLLLEDGAQGFGGEIRGKKACSFGDIATTSFFPAKPLGCYGDGGAIFTNSDEWAELIRSYAVHGKSGDNKYDNIRIGMNSRLDTIQAAILKVKLDAFKEYEVSAVNKVAEYYTNAFREKKLDAKIKLPVVKENYLSSWAQYTIILPEDIDRAELQAELKSKNIPSMVYYMKPMHLQGAFDGTQKIETECGNTEKLCKTVLSLPIDPYLEKKEVEIVVNNIADFLKR